MLGFLFGSLLIASLSAAIVDYQMMQKDKNQKLRALRQYLLERQVEGSLATPVQKQALERLARQDRLQWKEVALLEMISARLRHRLHFSVLKAHLIRHPLLRLWIFL